MHMQAKQRAPQGASVTMVENGSLAERISTARQFFERQSGTAAFVEFDFWDDKERREIACLMDLDLIEFFINVLSLPEPSSENCDSIQRVLSAFYNAFMECGARAKIWVGGAIIPMGIAGLKLIVHRCFKESGVPAIVMSVIHTGSHVNAEVKAVLAQREVELTAELPEEQRHPDVWLRAVRKAISLAALSSD